MSIYKQRERRSLKQRNNITVMQSTELESRTISY